MLHCTATTLFFDDYKCYLVLPGIADVDNSIHSSLHFKCQIKQAGGLHFTVISPSAHDL